MQLVVNNGRMINLMKRFVRVKLYNRVFDGGCKDWYL